MVGSILINQYQSQNAIPVTDKTRGDKEVLGAGVSSKRLAPDPLVSHQQHIRPVSRQTDLSIEMNA